MKTIKKRIIVTGGNGRFAKVLKKNNKKFKIFFPDKKTLNILSEKSIKAYIKKNNPDYLLHCAALSRPMIIHDKNISGCYHHFQFKLWCFNIPIKKQK